MRWAPRKLGLWATLLAAMALMAVGGGGGVAAAAGAEEAYVTLLYGDEFVLGVRVLGKSIRDMGTRRDLVVLVSDGVSDYSRKLLEADGFIVKHITLLANPNQVRPTRFWGVYTKLKIFNMTTYRKVVYLDADTVVVKSIEDLFNCGKFCANLKHSERMNSGVMVVEPSETLFKDMMNKVDSLPSYTGGDQGFLNSYYADFANSHVYDPNKTLTPEPETQRLSTLYNADVGLYMLANKWMVDEKELRVIHYTLGPLKPWDWWTSWLVKPVAVWQNVRQNLEESLPGTGGGKNPRDQLVVIFLFILPFCMLLCGYYGSCFQTNKELLSMRTLCAFARQARYKYKSEEALPSYSTVGVASSSFGISNQKVGSFSTIMVDCDSPPSSGSRDRVAPAGDRLRPRPSSSSSPPPSLPPRRRHRRSPPGLARATLAATAPSSFPSQFSLARDGAGRGVSLGGGGPAWRRGTGASRVDGWTAASPLAAG